ncbi:MAG: hypothetical protein CEE38_20255 [Planctomycetes bacterium B3_Pla]|nr:MAG: hypothetical protein CEE38_20255 [Planctomycetes bacterium B3_Pla]
MTKKVENRSCPYCKEDIKTEAIKCKHCGTNVAPENPRHEGTCPYCKETIHPEAAKCKHCKSSLDMSSGEPASRDGGDSTAFASGSNAMRGVGDVIAGVTSRLGIIPCHGCKQRQEWLNSRLPFKSQFRQE